MICVRLKVLMFILLTPMISCGESDSNCLNLGPKGKYMIEIYQSGSYLDFSISSTVSAGNCNSIHFYNNDGKLFNDIYEVGQIDNKKSFAKYYTDNDATFLSFELTAIKIGESKKDSMVIRAKGYYNDEELFDLEHIFFAWDEKDIDECGKFNIYNTNLAFYLTR